MAERSTRIDRKKEPKAKSKAPRRKAVNGGAKGAAFERLIARQFSLWISQGANQDLLWRSAGSGGRSTQRRKQTGKGIEYHASDIAPLHPDAAPFVDVFTLECKNYKALELRQIVYDWPSSVVAKWWAQARRDAESVDRIPLMVVKENLKPALLVAPDLGLGEYLCKKDIMHVTQPLVGVCIIDLATALTIPYSKFRSLYVPGSVLDRPAPHRQRIRRVPLVGV